MIDLRSDTVSQPTDAMRADMAAAEVGDDGYGEDPTVNELQEMVADLLGKEAALFVTSGTQGNLCALLAHCGRGDEYMVGEHAHAYRYEGGGAAVLGSIQPQPVPINPDGMIDLLAAEAAVKADDVHYARTRLLCLENTISGRVLTLDQMADSKLLAGKHGLAHHLDGARLWNASVALGVAPAAVAELFDSVSVCLSKGLGAPMGSLLVGQAALIKEAHKWRKMLGGALRQAGMVAAAGIHALKHHIDRLSEDHTNAARLAEGLSSIEGIKVEAQATNMVFIDVGISGNETPVSETLESKTSANKACATSYGSSESQAYISEIIRKNLVERGINTTWDGSKSRLVTHLNVSQRDIDFTVEAFKDLLG